MTAAVPTVPALYPPTVTPPAQPLPLRKFVFRFVRNPLLALPQAAYEDRFVRLESSRYNVYWVVAPDLVEDVLIKHTATFLKSPVEKRVFRRTLKDGVLSADGALWRWQRRTMAPLFRPSEMANYLPGMAQPAEELLAKWRAAPPGSVQQVDHDMTDATFAVIERTMLQGGAPRESAIIKRATGQSLAYISWEIMYGALNVPLWFPHPASWILKRSAKRLRGAVADIIVRRQREGGGGSGDLLGRLLDARDPETGEPMSMEQLVNNLLTLLEAGHETTARALTWTLYLLARAPEWQDAARAEIAALCGEGKIAPEHIGALQVTQQVLKEAMRLYAPVPVVSRVAMQTVELTGGRQNRKGIDGGHPDLLHPPPSPALERPGPFRPDALCSGARGGHAAHPVHAVRRRRAHLSRQQLRHDRGHRHAGNPDPRRTLRLGRQDQARAGVARHPATAWRHAAPGDAAYPDRA